jgi:6-phosphogluconolactonase (cycloisomerase 2 family)
MGQLGPDPVEQNSSHPHQLCFDRSGQNLLVPDKGFDEVFSYKFNTETGELNPNQPPSVKLPAGAGPRHLAFHPNPATPFAYVMNELDSTVATFKYSEQSGELELLQVISALPADFSGVNTGAEIMVAPSGNFVYCSNRGHDSITVFSVDATTGKLNPIQWQATHGKNPRFFTLDSSGEFLYAANQDGDTIAIFQVDPLTGLLSFSEQVVSVGNPVYIALV